MDLVRKYGTWQTAPLHIPECFIMGKNLNESAWVLHQCLEQAAEKDFDLLEELKQLLPGWEPLRPRPSLGLMDAWWCEDIPEYWEINPGMEQWLSR